ncbi:receptor-type tyrosine-protein phosphatase eta-like [Hyperolius riggenbachi]|uniref:receptor-type tyrosine-protein phosphatase eta-like n=1 Tax=Hyperolius riggenbachi TaxID=752182 RepID=UPI0035A373BC
MSSGFSVESSCADASECQPITVQYSTHQINVSGLVDGVILQNITDPDGSVITASGGSYNNTSLMSFVSGTQYIIYYGNDTYSCCYNVTTKPYPVELLQKRDQFSNAVYLGWSRPEEYQSAYSYRVLTNVTSSSSTLINDTTVTSESATVMGLTPGETYIFTVYTVAADGVTESDPVSIVICLLLEPMATITVSSYQSVNSLVASWAAPAGKVDYYNISITGDVNNTIQTNTTSVTFSGLSPGRYYTVYVYTVSQCGATGVSVTEATYPNPPGMIFFYSVGTSSLALSWGEPVDMASVTKSYIITYWNSSSSAAWTVSSNTTDVTLQSLASGANYTIAVVTVGILGYQSTPVTQWVFTQPSAVSFLEIIDRMYDWITVAWSSPDEYQSTYSYRVEINVTSSSSLISNTTVTNQSATMMDLTPGEIYTFTVYAIAADNITKSDPAFTTSCTDPPQPSVVVNNSISTTCLKAMWTTPPGRLQNYSVYLSETIYNTYMQKYTNDTEAVFEGLNSSTEYTIVVWSNSYLCSSRSAPVTEATRPSQPEHLTCSYIRTHFSLSWEMPTDMVSVSNVTYEISYGNSSWIAQDNATGFSLAPWTNNTIYVVTIGVRGYKSPPVAITPGECANLTNCTDGVPAYITLDNYKLPDVLGVSWQTPTGSADFYTVRLSGEVNGTLNTSLPHLNFTGLLPGREYAVTIESARGRCVQTSLVIREATYPTSPRSLMWKVIGTDTITFSWDDPVNMAGVRKSYQITYWNSSSSTTETSSNNYTLQNLTPGTRYAIAVRTVGALRYQSEPVSILLYTSSVEQPGSVRVNTSLSGTAMDITFQAFDASNGPIVAYAIIVTTNLNGNKPVGGDLSKTYNDFKSGLSKTYVSSIIEQTATQRGVRSSAISAHVGDGSKTHAYVNGPLDPNTQYRVGIAGFTSINYDPITDTINEEKSAAILTSYTKSTSTTTTSPYTTTTLTTTATQKGSSNAGAIIGGVIGSVAGVLVLALLGYCCYRKRRETTGDLKAKTSNRKHNVSSEMFEAMFDKLKANDHKRLMVEFESLLPVGILQSRSVAILPVNVGKNQPDAVVPYDKSRVKLSAREGSYDGYINASYIPGFASEKEFIAAQNPLPNTVRDFWRMIWEKGINTIVMLSRCLENGKVCSEEYWPTREAKTFGDFTVAFMSEKANQYWTVRDFMAVNVKNHESRQVRQFQYTSYYEHWNYDDRNTFTEFVNVVQQHRKDHSPNNPTLVHCRSGAGRSGIFIALECIINRLEKENTVDIYGTVHRMNLHRATMVQTEDQYLLLYQCTEDIIRSRKGEGDPYSRNITIVDSIYEKIPDRIELEDDDNLYQQTLNCETNI